MSKNSGLPETKRMRHDSHFVEEITSQRAESIGRLIDIGRIEPNPHQPRKNFGDLTEMVASVKEKGVLEPLLVRQVGDRYEIIAGERRFRAAQQAGLTQVPCIEIDVDDRGCLEISLVENLQRRDLTPFEEADALHQLRERFAFTHDQIARKLSRSRTSVTEALSLAGIPPRIRKKCARAGINARSTLLQLARLNEEADMEALIATIQQGSLSRDDVRRIVKDNESDSDQRSPEARAPSGYVFRHQMADRPYALTLRFPERTKVTKKDLIAAIKQILRDLQAGD